jgi:DNA-binding FadR family transcriptional regulator
MGHVKRRPLDQTQAMMGDVSRRSVREVIVEKLAALVSSGVLAVGDELPGERELAASLSVSRQTVRGAIGILASHGILRVAQGARTTVATSDTRSLSHGGVGVGFDGPYDLHTVHQARLLVERRIATDAARLIDADGLQRLRTSIAAQEDCGDDPVRFLLCDREFHVALYRAAGNDVLFDVAMSLYNHMLDHRRRIVAKPGSIAKSLSDHRAILSALETGDLQLAERAVIKHATRIYVTTRTFLKM